MDFKFIIDKNYLLLKMISNRNNIQELNQWKNNVVANILDKNIIEIIEDKKECIEEYFMSGEFKQFLLENNLDSKIKQIVENDLFNKYYNEAIDYLNSIQDKWLSKKDEINNWLKETIKINPSKESITVYITHPRLNAGKCVDQKCIFWGHYKGIDDVGYNITYLCHENLHALLPNDNCMPPAMKLYHDKSKVISNQEHWKLLNSSIENYYMIYEFEFDIIHTVIELISDNELYTILSGDSKYKEGHNNPDYSLVKYKELILPYWFEYLGLSKEEIKLRIPNFIDKKGLELKNEDKLNIESFINFLINNTYIRSKFEVPDLVFKKMVK